MEKKPKVGEKIRGWTPMDAEAERQGDACHKLAGWAAKPFAKGKKVGTHRHRI